MLLDDANFNVVGIMDDDHNLTERREYHPYGKRQIFINGGNDSSDYRCTAEIPHPTAVQPWGSSPKAYSICDEGHQGLMHDKETGQINNRARFLDPTLCRYIGRDPMKYIDGNSLYAYLMDSPGDYRDPWGMEIDIDSVFDGVRDLLNPEYTPVIGEPQNIAVKDGSPQRIEFANGQVLPVIPIGNNVYPASGPIVNRTELVAWAMRQEGCHSMTTAEFNRVAKILLEANPGSTVSAREDAHVSGKLLRPPSKVLYLPTGPPDAGLRDVFRMYKAGAWIPLSVKKQMLKELRAATRP